MFSYITKSINKIFCSFENLKKFLIDMGHPKRKFVGYPDSPSYIVIQKIMKEKPNTKLTSVEWHSIINKMSKGNFYGEMPLSTVRSGLNNLFKQNKINKVKIDNIMRYYHD